MNSIKNIIAGKFIQGVLWNFASLAVLTVCGILLNLIIAWNYSTSVLGVFNQVYAIYIVASQFAVIGIHLSVLKHTSEFCEDRAETHHILMSGIFLSAFFSIITCSLLWILRTWIGKVFQSPDIEIGIIFITPGLFFFSINKVLLSYLNGLSKIKEFAIFQSTRYVLLILCLILLISKNVDGSQLPLIFTVSEFLLFITMLIKLPEIFRPITIKKLSEWISRQFKFGMRGFLSNVLLDLNTRVDILILGYLATDSVVGIYSLAVVLIEGLYQFPIALRVNYAPILVSMIKQDKKEELLALIQKGKSISFKLMTIIGIFSIAIFPLGFLFYGAQSEFLQSWPPFIILMVSLIFCSGYLPFSNIILQAGFPGRHTLMILIQVTMNILLNFLLASWLGAIGSAIATGISLLLLIPLIKIFTKKAIGLQI